MMSLYPDWVDENVEMIDNEEEEVLEGYGYNYDYKDQSVVITLNGRTGKTTPRESYLFWAYKNITTERFSRSCYSSDYGVEIESVIEQNYDRATTESEIARTITEALEVDARTIKVSDFAFEWGQSGELDVCFKLQSIYSTDVINITRGV